jgi:hypothetical protein
LTISLNKLPWLRKDVRDGLQAVKYGATLVDKNPDKFELEAHTLVAFFGGPGIHGYGQHICEQAESLNLPAFRCTCQFEGIHRIEVGFLSNDVEFEVEIKENVAEKVNLDVTILNLGKKFPFKSFTLEWNGQKELKENSKITPKRSSQSTLTSFFKKTVVKKSRANENDEKARIIANLILKNY